MATHVAGGKALPTAVLAQIVARTERVPLFVEELTKMVLASGWLREREDYYELTGPLPPLAIPTTLHESLLARLEGLGAAKTVAQVGAVWGRGVTEAQLQAVASLDWRQLAQALARLVGADMLREMSLPPRMTYVFKHALIQEAAYASLRLDERQQVHWQVAQVLVAQFPETVATQPGLLAHHYTEAGLNVPAISYWQRAGQRAIERSANVEAISHFTKGLELLKTLPDTPERAQPELALQLALGAPLLMIKGHTAQEVEQTYTWAQELCQQVGDSSQRFAALVGLWRFYLNRAQHQTARALATQCFTLAQRMHGAALLQEAHMMLGSTLFYMGELVSALMHLEQGITLYDPQQGRSLAFSRATDPGVVCLSWAAWTLWMLGYPDHALTRMHEALTLAQELSHAYSLSFALYCAYALHGLRREEHLLREKLEAVMALAREHGFSRWLAGGTIRRGWILARQGAVEEGLAQIHQGVARWRAIAGELGLTCTFTQLVEACVMGGRTTEGLQVLDEALALVHKNTERYYEVELYRLQGELLLLQTIPDEQQAETSFHHALAIARYQQAKSLELRAAMSLSRLWQKQGKHVEARELLTPIYDWFTEGFDTVDLQEARALLAALACSGAAC